VLGRRRRRGRGRHVAGGGPGTVVPAGPGRDGPGDERPDRRPGADLLDPAFLTRLERLQLATRRPLAGHLAGEHRSPAIGSSVDFADYREYHPGDDFRRIDYGLLARLDLLLVRLFEAEEDLHLRLLVDTSASMATGGKLDAARRVAAALGFVALIRRDPVSLHRFPLDRPGPRFTGRNGVPALFAHLRALEAGGETPFAHAATALLGRRGPPGLTVVVSDLLTPEWEDGLDRLPAGGGDVVVVHVLAEEELRPSLAAEDLVGDLDLVDVETGARLGVSLGAAALADYERAAAAWADGVAQRCRRRGTAYVRLLAGDDLEQVLLAGWRAAGVLR
jgi:uncharacterized protein (DUF58 family)